MITPQNNEMIFRSAGGEWQILRHPSRILCAHSVEEVLPVLEEAAAFGGWAAGYLAYEAAPAFDAALPALPGRGPLAWFGLYAAPERIELPEAGALRTLWTGATAPEAYFEQIRKIKEHIAEGDSYQVNHTIRLHAEVADPWQLFRSCMTAGRFSAYIQSAERAVCSASPELFFELDGNAITCRPMKGTGEYPEKLAASLKDRAENIMIVDMIRNDLGRICRPGSIVAAPLYAIEPVGDIWQMTSTVKGQTDAGITEIFKALFPCASVTGAPKRRSMQIISALESTPRGVYCGAIGYIAPQRKARFSVAIRTAEVDRRTGAAVYGAGGGIVWDSQPAAEWSECALKAEILGGARERWPDTRPPRSEVFGAAAELHDLGDGVMAPALPNSGAAALLQDPLGGGSRAGSRSCRGHVSDASGFQLLETMLFDNGIAWMDEHIARLTRSAAGLGFRFDPDELQCELASVTGERQRLRLLLSRDGRITLERAPFPAQSEAVRKLRFARVPVDPQNPWLYHKTTCRDIYTRARAEFPEADDVLLWNRAGQVTESTIANLVAEIQGVLVTPPVACGLLPGTMRAALLKQGVLVERAITRAELWAAGRIYLINSLRSWMPAEIMREC